MAFFRYFFGRFSGIFCPWTSYNEHLWQETYAAGAVFRSSALCLLNIGLICCWVKKVHYKWVVRLVLSNSISSVPENVSQEIWLHMCSVIFKNKKVSFMLRSQMIKLFWNWIEKLVKKIFHMVFFQKFVFQINVEGHS